MLDFDRLLANGAVQGNAEDEVGGAHGEEDEDPDRPMFSLVTGTYRHAKRYGDKEDSAAALNGSTDVILRNQDGTVATLKDSAAGTRNTLFFSVELELN